MAQLILFIRAGDIPEILGDTGYLVTSSSPERLALKDSMNIPASRYRQGSENTIPLGKY